MWNFLKGSNSRRSALIGKLETVYRKAVLRHDKPSVSSSTTTPSVSRSSRVNSSPSPDTSLSRASISLNRFSSGVPEAVSKKLNTKSSKSKKNYLLTAFCNFTSIFFFCFACVVNRYILVFIRMGSGHLVEKSEEK